VSLQDEDRGGHLAARTDESPRNSERTRRKVLELTSRAGIIEPKEQGSGTLATEPILVFRGPSKSSLKIFDQYGNQIGSASRDGTEYTLCDAEPRCIVAETKRPQGPEYQFSVRSPQGAQIGTISQEKVRMRDLVGRNDRTIELRPRITCDGRTIAMIERRPRKPVIDRRAPPRTLIARVHYLLDRFSCQRLAIEDEPGHEAARITYVRPSFFRNHVSYVLDFQPGTHEAMRTMSMAACLVADNRIVDIWEWGGA